jgi:hypothetical protein
MKHRDFTRKLKSLVRQLNKHTKAQLDERKKLPPREAMNRQLADIGEILALHVQRQADESTQRAKILEGLAEARAEGAKIGGNRREPKVSRKVLRRLVKRGYSQNQLAKRYGVSQGWISNQLSRKGRKP